jgi:hypothetical protein
MLAPLTHTLIPRVFAGLCLFILVGCASHETALQKSVRIESFSVVKTAPDSIDIDLVVSNNGLNGSLCLYPIAISKDGLVRPDREKVWSIDVPVGQMQHIPAKVYRPIGSGQLKTDYLAIILSRCTGQEELAHQFDWPYVWSESRSAQPVRNYPDIYGAFFHSLSEEDFTALDALLQKWNNPDERDEDGNWKLETFRYAADWPGKRVDWHEDLKRLQRWRNFNPMSPGAAIAEAKYWAAYAWHIRGDENNPDVDPVAIKAFDERMKRAEQILISSRDFASSNPLWYETYLNILIDQKRGDVSIDNLYSEGVSRHPYFHPLYFDMAKRWCACSGGNVDWEKVDEVVNQAVALTSAKDGTINYALLYLEIIGQQTIEFDPFQDSLISWPKMRESFEELVKRYPSPGRLNQFAAYACRAGDKKTYFEIRPRIVAQIEGPWWPSNYSIDLCDHRFMQYS